MSRCETCGGLGFTQGEKREPCACVNRRKARVYLKRLHPMSPVPEAAQVLDQADTDRNLLIRVPASFQPLQMKWVFAYLLLKRGVRRTYDLLNAYDIVLVKFGDHERYPTLLRVNSEVLCAYYGFNEVKNALMGEIVLSLLDLREVEGLQNWLLMRGTPTYFDLFRRYAGDREYQVLDLSRTGDAYSIEALSGSKTPRRTPPASKFKEG